MCLILLYSIVSADQTHSLDYVDTLDDVDIDDYVDNGKRVCWQNLLLMSKYLDEVDTLDDVDMDDDVDTELDVDTLTGKKSQ